MHIVNCDFFFQKEEVQLNTDYKLHHVCKTMIKVFNLQKLRYQ
jgi:hypothetical protein